MKNLPGIILLLLLTGQLHAQVIPTNATVSVSYTVETTSFRQVANSTDFNALNDFEKLSFRQRKEQNTVQKYLTAQNDITTVITYGAREGFEETTQGEVKKMIIDANGVFSLNAQGQVIASEPHSAKALAMQAALRQNVSAASFEKLPDFVQPTDAMIQTARTQGYEMSGSATLLVVRNAEEEYIYDTAKKLLQSKVFVNGRPFMTSQTYYTLDAAGQKIPSVTIETSYDISEAGVIIENVEVQKFTNYIRSTR